LESSTTVSIRSVSPAIGYAGVRMAPDRSYQFKIEVIEESGEVTSPHPARFGRARKRARPSARRRRRLPSTCWAPAAALFLNSRIMVRAWRAARGFGGQMSPHPPSFSASFGTHLNAACYQPGSCENSSRNRRIHSSLKRTAPRRENAPGIIANQQKIE
jgi:rRNA maturation protein Nop10